MHLFRLLKIISVSIRYGLDEFLGHGRAGTLRALIGTLFFWRSLAAPRAVRLRQALEALGPIFVKFGQILSTRRDLLPADIADELAKLQDRVPPFPSDLAVAEIEGAFGKPIGEIFASFDREPVASASIAQVHFAALRDGHPAAVKVLRPGMLPVIHRDLELLDAAAGLVERTWSQGKRFKPRELAIVDPGEEKLRRDGADERHEHVPLRVPGIALRAEELLRALAED